MAENERQEPVEFVDKRAAARGDEANGERAAPADPPTGGTAEAVQDASAELAAEREKAETYYKNWQRSAADFINYKRRVEQEKGETTRFAQAALVINLLPVFDDLDRAVSTVDANLAGLNWVQGVVAIHRKFAHLLEAMGVQEIAAAGEPFDPARHEAVGQQAGAEGRVLHVVQKGYTLGDRVVRPAMVIVGSGEGSGTG